MAKRQWKKHLRPSDYFRKHIKRIREEVGLSQAEAARRANIAPAYLCQIEKGTKRAPSPLVIMDLANVYRDEGAEEYEVDLPELLMMIGYLEQGREPGTMNNRFPVQFDHPPAAQIFDKFFPVLMQDASFSRWFAETTERYKKYRHRAWGTWEELEKMYMAHLGRVAPLTQSETKAALRAPDTLKLMVLVLVTRIKDLTGEDEDGDTLQDIFSETAHDRQLFSWLANYERTFDRWRQRKKLTT